MKALARKHWATVKRIDDATFMATIYREGRKTPVHVASRASYARALEAALAGASLAATVADSRTSGDLTTVNLVNLSSVA